MFLGQFYIHNPWIVFALERNSIPEVLGSDMVVFLSNIQQGLNITKKKLFLVKDLISGKFLTANVKKKNKARQTVRGMKIFGCCIGRHTLFFA